MGSKYVLLSGGGFDSISVLVLFPELIACVLGIDFGQKAMTGERASNEYFCRKYKKPYLHLNAVKLSQFIKHPTLLGGPDNFVVDGKWQDSFEGDRLEARNLLLLSHAVVFSCAKGLDGVVTGFHKESSDSFPDALPEFYKKFSEVTKVASSVPVQFRAPLQEYGWGRTEVLERSLSVDWAVWYAYTCYGVPQKMTWDIFSTVPCRKCVHCYKRFELREKLIKLGIPSEQLPLDTLGYKVG